MSSLKTVYTILTFIVIGNKQIDKLCNIYMSNSPLEKHTLLLELHCISCLQFHWEYSQPFQPVLQNCSMFSEPRMSKLNNWDLEGVEDKQQGQDKPKKNPDIKGGTLSVFSSDPTCKDYNSRFTMVSLKALSDQVWIRHPCFSFFKAIVKITEINTFWVW